MPGNQSLFVGRGSWLTQLDGALAVDRSRIVMLHGLGGVGKTTILWNWLQRLRELEFTDGHPAGTSRLTSGRCFDIEGRAVHPLDLILEPQIELQRANSLLQIMTPILKRLGVDWV